MAPSDPPPPPNRNDQRQNNRPINIKRNQAAYSTNTNTAASTPYTSAIKNSLINYDFFPTDTLVDMDPSYCPSNDLPSSGSNSNNFRKHIRGASSSSSGNLMNINSSSARIPVSYTNKQNKPARPTLITGYNFSNNFVESPTSLYCSTGSSQSVSNSNSVTDTPITQINKRIQNLQKTIADNSDSSTSNLDVLNNNSFSNLFPAAARNATEYRTQPNSFNDSSLDISKLRSSILSNQQQFSKKQINNEHLPISDCLYNAIDDDDDEDEVGGEDKKVETQLFENDRRSSIDGSRRSEIVSIDAAQGDPQLNQENVLDEDSSFIRNRSTLLERDFPAEILPFELLDKKDGDYFINNDKAASLYYNDNYGSLRNELFDDIINPLEDTRLMRVRTEKKMSALHNNDTSTPGGSPDYLLKSENKKEPQMRPRTYSESETANFSTITGERLYYDNKHRPFYSLHANHEKLQDDSIHSTKNNSAISINRHKKPLYSKKKSAQNGNLPKEKSAAENAYSGLDLNSQSDINLSDKPHNLSVKFDDYNNPLDSDEKLTIPINITLHGGTIVPDENYKPMFMPKTSYNKSLELSKTHQLATSTMALLNNNNNRLRLHPNVTIYHNFESLLGCEDEYISGLDFKTSIGQWFSDDKDYDRFYKLQVISSHIHDTSKDDETKVLATIHSLQNIKHIDEDHDELTADMPNHDDDPHLSDAPHDYSFKHVTSSEADTSGKSEKIDTIEKKKIMSNDALDSTNSNVVYDPGSELRLLRNQNLKNYSKNILNIHDTDYNNFTGGHSKLKEIPEFIINKSKSTTTDLNNRPKKISSNQLGKPFGNTVCSTSLRIQSPRESPKKSMKQEQPTMVTHRDKKLSPVLSTTKHFSKGLAIGNMTVTSPPSVKVSTTDIISKSSSHHHEDEHHRGYANLEHGTVVMDNSLSSSTSSSANSSPLVINELKRKLSSLVPPAEEAEKKISITSTAPEKELEVKQEVRKVVPKQSVSETLTQPSVIKKLSANDASKPINEVCDGTVVDYDAIISKLPDDFVQLSFTKRRNILLELVPKNTKSLDSKLLLQKIKQRFSNNSPQSKTTNKKSLHPSAATMFLSRTSKTAAKPAPATKQNIDVKGSIVMHHELGKIIGYGSWGIVRECFSLNPEDNTDAVNSSDASHRLIRAIKIVKTKNELVKKCFQKEIRIWKLLNHRRLLPLLFVKETSYAIFCITPRIYGGTLFDIVSNWGEYNDPNSPIVISKRLLLIRKFAFEILDGLSYMHYNGIVHGDLKLENCLIDEIRNPSTNKVENHILVCDFGMSTFYIDPERTKNNVTSSARASYTMLNERNHVTPPLSNSSESHTNRPLIPRSSSSGFLATKNTQLRKIVFDRSKTHDDTPMHITQRQYGPAPTSTSLNILPIVFNYIQNDQPSNDKTPMPHTHIGSLPYASPEILLPNPPPLGPTADIWALGVLLYTMIVGRLPFKHNFEPRLTAIIARGKYDIQSLQNAGGSDPALVDIVNGCLTKDITLRWDLEKIVETLQKPTI